jgi:beta-ribofuranosylaminobenzene 5'-phosphate synthase
MSQRIQIRTPSRLHFGLFGWGPAVLRQFGGIGLMIDSPGVELSVERAPSWIAEGALASRLEAIIARLRERMLQCGRTLPPARVCVRNAPAEHVGLGSGTQLSLAVTRALLELAGFPDPGPSALAKLTGRGARSGIGLHGFHHGGLIVDGGRKREGEIPPLLARASFPEEWSILIVQPPGVSGLHGPEESDAFAKLPPISRDAVDALCRLVLIEILPAVLEHDLEAFGAGLGELQERVGAAFAPAQGGIYATPQAALIVNELKSLGFVGTGQSSWGPTIYAFSELPQSEIDLLTDRLRATLDLARSSIFSTRAANRGAVLECARQAAL